MNRISHKPVEAKRKLIVALQCYIDESLDGYGNHTAVMAGYVADSETWKAFNVDWQMEIKNQKIEIGFATFNKKIFEGKKPTKNAESFYRIIEKHLDKAFCITCSIPEYKGVLATCRFPKSFQTVKYYNLFQSEPNGMLYRAFMDFCFDQRKMLGINEPVDLIFDESNKYKDWINSSFKYLYYSAKALGINPKLLGKKPIFMDDEKTPALQAADLLARIVRYNLVEGNDATKMPWNKQKEMKHLITEMGKSYILQIFDSSFSEKNNKVYSRYALIRFYWLQDFFKGLRKCLSAFISAR